MITLYCQSQKCGFNYIQVPSAANLSACPKCFGNWFASEPPKNPIELVPQTLPDAAPQSAALPETDCVIHGKLGSTDGKCPRC